MKNIFELETQLQQLEGERNELLSYRQQAEREQQLRRWSHLRQDELITFFKQALGYEPTQPRPAQPTPGPLAIPATRTAVNAAYCCLLLLRKLNSSAEEIDAAWGN